MDDSSHIVNFCLRIVHYDLIKNKTHEEKHVIHGFKDFGQQLCWDVNA